ncbi:hypothetical protein EV187_1568 [Agromyces ramosus]|uniref:Uncharacterized protein n=1 Tax=Agromyces ramosus TaxID=33879 RepID=A0A4Q7MCW0_9MICO|nr:hypothetical protein [Agromyces ramosus]RZS65864.1 hypothetical protein EV187_1568 [Agromyces ramosus]
MPEIDDLLDAERNRRRPARRARVALIVAGAATVVALGAGAALAATGAASLIQHDAESSAVDDVVAPSIEPMTPTAVPSTSANEPTATEPTAAPQPALEEFGFPVYDASTDIATIPRPVADHDPANTEIWLTQQGIIADCMQEKGLEYRFTGYWLIPPGITWEQQQIALELAQAGTPEFEALHGVSEFGPDDPDVVPEYRWEDAGCVGYAVHVTGMDDAH